MKTARRSGDRCPGRGRCGCDVRWKLGSPQWPRLHGWRGLRIWRRNRDRRRSRQSFLRGGSRALFTDCQAGTQDHIIKWDFFKDLAGSVEEIDWKRKVEKNLISIACERNGCGGDGMHEQAELFCSRLRVRLGEVRSEGVALDVIERSWRNGDEFSRDVVLPAPTGPGSMTTDMAYSSFAHFMAVNLSSDEFRQVDRQHGGMIRSHHSSSTKARSRRATYRS